MILRGSRHVVRYNPQIDESASGAVIFRSPRHVIQYDRQCTSRAVVLRSPRRVASNRPRVDQPNLGAVIFRSPPEVACYTLQVSKWEIKLVHMLTILVFRRSHTGLLADS